MATSLLGVLELVEETLSNRLKEECVLLKRAMSWIFFFMQMCRVLVSQSGSEQRA